MKKLGDNMKCVRAFVFCLLLSILLPVSPGFAEIHGTLVADNGDDILDTELETLIGANITN